MTTPSMDVSELSDEQQQKLQQYISITAQPAEEAVPLLQRSQWNVDVRTAGWGTQLR